MEVEMCPSCRSNALSIRKQQVDENHCIQSIECDQCAFHMEERWIAVNFHSVFHTHNIVEDIRESKMAVPISS
jgi:protein-arginine kinase activator protein McsA